MMITQLYFLSELSYQLFVANLLSQFSSDAARQFREPLPLFTFYTSVRFDTFLNEKQAGNLWITAGRFPFLSVLQITC